MRKRSSTRPQIARESIPVQELARRWKVHPRTVKRRIQSGELDAFRISNQIRIYNDSIEAFERRNRII
jgi:excisionase family DNA binding protein